MAFKMAGYSAFTKGGPVKGVVESVGADGEGLIVRTSDGVRKVSGGAKGIAEVKEGMTVSLTKGPGGKLTLNGKSTDDELTGGPQATPVGPRAR
jgi:hypothetical protein